MNSNNLSMSVNNSQTSSTSSSAQFLSIPDPMTMSLPRFMVWTMSLLMLIAGTGAGVVELLMRNSL